MRSNRGFHLSSTSQKSNASSCLSCLLARPLFKQFEIKWCLLSLMQTFMIPHKAHICAAGIAHRRSGTKDLNDLTENRKTITIIFTVHKLQQCLNYCFSQDTIRINFLSVIIYKKNYTHLID